MKVHEVVVEVAPLDYAKRRLSEAKQRINEAIEAYNTGEVGLSAICQRQTEAIETLSDVVMTLSTLLHKDAKVRMRL